MSPPAGPHEVLRGYGRISGSFETDRTSGNQTRLSTLATSRHRTSKGKFQAPQSSDIPSGICDMTREIFGGYSRRAVPVRLI
jgi:hypothetical protein